MSYPDWETPREPEFETEAAQMLVELKAVGLVSENAGLAEVRQWLVWYRRMHE